MCRNRCGCRIGRDRYQHYRLLQSKQRDNKPSCRRNNNLKDVPVVTIAAIWSAPASMIAAGIAVAVVAFLSLPNRPNPLPNQPLRTKWWIPAAIANSIIVCICPIRLRVRCLRNDYKGIDRQKFSPPIPFVNVNCQLPKAALSIYF